MSYRHQLRLAVAVVAAALAAGSSRPVPGQEPEVPPPEDRIFVTDFNAQERPGCGVIDVIDARNGRALEQPRDPQQQIGQIAVTSDGTVALAGSAGISLHFIAVTNQHGARSKVWTHQFIEIRRLLRDSAVAVLPDNSAYLLNLQGGTLGKYSVADVLSRMVGQPSASVSVGEVGEIVFSRDGGLAYALNSDGEIHVIDVATMTEVGVIPYEPVRLSGERRLFNTYATASPDGHYLVVNSARGYVSVVKLADGTAVRRQTPRISTTYGVAFNYNEAAEPLLAVHGNSIISVYRFDGSGPLELLAWTSVPPQALDHLRIGSLAWTGRGDALVAVIKSMLEFRILDYGGDPPALSKRLDFDACTSTLPNALDWAGTGQDVATIHDRPVLPTPTPTATQPTATPTATMTPVEPTATSTLPATLNAVPSATATPTTTASPSATAIATARPAPVFLPLVLTESCRPGQHRVDVALVVDASTSMRERTSTGRSKLEAAVEAVGLFLDQLSLPSDQAAIVEFNSGVRVLQGLTGDRASLDEALGRIQVREQTRIDLGIQAAREELRSNRSRPGNQAVMIVLTDGRANPVGPDAALREAGRAKGEGVIVFTIGLGEDLDLAALEAMSSKPSYFYRAPDAEDLAEIYSKIAVEIPCPAEDYWGRR